MNKKLSRTLNTLIGMTVALMVAAAIREQLSLPPAERTWHGKLAGVPYDFRMPTIERLQNAYWNKDTSQLLVPQAFGMGWAVKFYPLVHAQTIPQSIK